MSLFLSGRLWTSFPLLYSHSMVLGGLLLMSYTTLLTPFTSFIILEDTRRSTPSGRLAQSAVIPSTLVTALTATVFSYVLSSPITPTVLTGRSTANACHSLVYKPAFFISSSTIASASLSISHLAGVTAPIILMARPGPGKGWRLMSSSESPSSRPRRRTSSLKSSLNGSTSFRCIFLSSPPTLWWLFIVADGPLKEVLSITSG